jgi:uncharacterized membrane protein YidH (DUF202 family)
MRIMGFILAVIGVLALVYGGISYHRDRTVVDLGPIQATATEQHNVPLSPIVGSILVLGGVLLMVMRRRQTA